MDTTPPELIALYSRLYILTRPKCNTCLAPLSCCSLEYCLMAKDIAKERGVELEETKEIRSPRLPFMSEGGCVVPPHLRPLCTMHTCKMNSLGFEPGDPEFTDQWHDLVSQISELEMKER
jgi:hypothetical protein